MITLTNYHVPLMHKILLLFVCVPGLSPALQAQRSDTVSNRTNLLNILNTEVTRKGAYDHSQTLFTFNTRYEGLKGTPYVHETPLPGKIVFSDGGTSEKDNLKLMLDVYDNRLWAIGRETPLRGFELPPDQVKSFRLRFPDGREALFQSYAFEEKEPRFWCEVLFEGEKYTLLKQHKKKFKKADYKNDGLRESGLPYDRFEDDPDYRMKSKNGGFERIALRKNALLKVAGVSEKGAVATFCKEKKIEGALKAGEAAALLAFLEGL